MPEYYDYVLVCIPVALVGVTLGLRVVGVDATAALSIGAAAASLVAGHALFVNGPVDATDPPVATRSQSTASNRPVNAD